MVQVYLYKCPFCGETAEIGRPVERRDDPTFCPEHPTGVSVSMRRVFCAPFFTANRLGDLPENKYALGFSETERLETMRADDKRYEEQWSERKPLRYQQPETKDFAELHQDLHGVV